MTGNTGQVFIYKKTNFNNADVLRRSMKHSNVVVNLIGPTYNCRKIEDFEEANVHIPRRLARMANNIGVKRFIHFSALGVHPDSESYDLRTKFIGE